MTVLWFQRLKLQRGEPLSNVAFNGFKCWRPYTQELRVKMRRFIFRMMKKELGNAFDQWANTLEENKRNREMDAFNGQMNALKQKQLEKFALKLQNIMLTKAWNHWHNLFVQLRKIKVTLVGRCRFKLNPG